MHTRTFLLLAAVVLVPGLAGAAALPASGAAAQDAAACMSAVDNEDWAGVMSACPDVLAGLPEEHPYYLSWTQSLNYAYQQACQTAAQGGQWDTVIATCEPAVAANPDAFIVNYFLGLAYQAKEDWSNAGISFGAFLAAARGSQSASQMGEQISMAQRSGGLAYARVRAFQDAIPLLQAAAQGNAEDVEVNYRLGVALLSTGDAAGAERALANVVEHAPSPIPAVLFLAGQLAYNAGDYANADSRLSTYLQAAPNERGAPDAHYMLGQALQGTDADRAATHYQGFLSGAEAGDARVPDAAFALGTLYFNNNDCANAETYYNQFLELAPDHANAAQVTEILAEIAELGCEG